MTTPIENVWEFVGTQLTKVGMDVYEFPNGKAEHQVVIADAQIEGEQRHKDYTNGIVEFTVDVLGKDKKKVYSDMSVISTMFQGDWDNGYVGIGDGLESGMSVQKVESNWYYAGRVILKIKV